MLTEREIFDRMKTELRSAIADCDEVARQPKSGPQFIRLRRSLKLVEGCCRQAAHWRQDARWLIPGRQMEHVHQQARAWLHRPTVSSKKLFTKLAAALRNILNDLHRLENLPTLRTGPLLPKPLAGPLRSGASIQVPAAYVRSSAGVIVPAHGR